LAHTAGFAVWAKNVLHQDGQIKPSS
jgi:hypothetical protein